MFQDESKKRIWSRIQGANVRPLLAAFEFLGKHKVIPRVSEERRIATSSQTHNILHPRRFVHPVYHPPNFRHYFTLLSECFSTFAQATCLLSVSLTYLVLEVMYSPFFTQVCQPVLLGFHVPCDHNPRARVRDTCARQNSRGMHQSNTETIIIRKQVFLSN